MRVLKRQIVFNILTLGFSGYYRTKRLFEKDGLKQRIVGSEGILGLMLALPIIMTLMVVFGLLESFAELNDFFIAVNLMLEIEAVGTNVFETLTLFPFSFIPFCILHLYLGFAFIQHSRRLEGDDRGLVMLFGFYALDWNPSDFWDAPDSGRN